jgi:agmatine/peptidylarginine deiminase
MSFSQAMSKAASAGRYIYPAETTRHLATILGFPSRHSIASAYYDSACTDIANLASAISAFEPVRLYSRPEDLPKAQSMVNQAIPEYTGNASNISFIPCPTNHLWVRDTGPVYVLGADADTRSRRFAINFRFREWGKREEMGSAERAADGLDWPTMSTEQLDENATFARRVIESDTSPSPVTLVESRVCLEGGALVADGEGTLLATESSIINDNRNPGLSRSEIETELRRLLGVEKIIWFPGRKGLDITDVHADAEVSFIRPGVVVLSRPHASVPRPWLEVYEEIREILTNSVDAKGRPFKIHTVDEPEPNLLGELSYDEPATNYVNFYFVNGGLILPQFGDQVRDREAVEMFQKLCPGRVIRPVYMHTLPLAGGVIHCATQPVIAVEED